MNKVKNKVYKNEGNKEVVSNVPSSAETILDVGCGAGDNARILCRKGKSVDGITLSEKEKESAYKFCRNVYIHNLEKGLPSECKEKKV